MAAEQFWKCECGAKTNNTAFVHCLLCGTRRPMAAEKMVNERIGLMLGYEQLYTTVWNQMESRIFPYWKSPSGETLDKLPDFEHSRDACVEVLEWIVANGHEPHLEFYICKHHKLSRHSHCYGLAFLRLTPQQICAAALALGERKE